MIRFLRPYRLRFALAVICGICREASVILALGICAYMTACVKEGTPLSGHPWGMLLVLCVIARGVFSYLEGILSHAVAYHILVDFRVRLLQKFSRLCPDILLDTREGQVSATLMNDVEQLEWFYAHTLEHALVTAVVAVGVTVFLWRIHPVLALVFLAGGAALLLIPFAMHKKADAQGRRNRRLLGEAGAVTLEGIRGMRELLAMNWKDRYLAKSRAYTDRLTEAQMAYAGRKGTENGLLQLVVGTAAAGISLIGSAFLLGNEITAGQYAVLGTTIWIAYNPLLALTDLLGNFGNVRAASGRIAAFLARPERQVLRENDDVGKEKTASVEVRPFGGRPRQIGSSPGHAAGSVPAAPELSFTHVRFSYVTRDPKSGREVRKVALRDVSFTAPAGKKTVLVGRSGAGKSTCLHLLLGYWRPDGGSIRIGGQDLSEMMEQKLHGMVSAVPQDIYLFHDTLRANLKLGRPEATDAEVRRAAEAAGIDGFIRSLPDGYDTVTGDNGVQLSGGQRQRIAIARAYLRESPVLLLDEAASALDNRADRKLQEMLGRLSGRCTVLLSAHRYLDVRTADHIVVLDDGCVVQEGTFDALAAEDGVFRDLFASSGKQR